MQQQENHVPRSNLRIVTIGVLLLAFVTLALGQWISARWLYDGSFEAAEQRDALARARHAQAIFAHLKDLLERSAGDNATWDESYGFVLGLNPNHLDDIFAAESYKLLRLNGFAFVGLDGRVLYVRQYDRQQEKFVTPEEDFKHALALNGALGRHYQTQDRTGGYVRIGGETYSWGAAPIVHSDGRGPPVGFLVLISRLDEALLASASGTLDSQVELEIVPATAGVSVPNGNPLRNRDVRFSMHGDDGLEIRSALGVLDDGHVLGVKLTTPRVVHATALRATQYFLWTTLIFGTVLTALALWFIERRLLEPLQAANARNARNQARLEQAQTVGRVGSWYLKRGGAALEWSRETYRIFALEQGSPVSYERFMELVHPDDRNAVEQALQAALSGKSYRCEYRIRLENRIVWLLGQGEPDRDDQGTLTGVVGTIQDITERKEAEERIFRLAYFDGLTGLPNRQSFLELLAREIERARRKNGRFAVLFVDLDGFKTVNDTLGHHAGDLILQWASDRVQKALRPSDIVARDRLGSTAIELARLGGDEFTALVCDLGRPEDALGVAHRLRDLMRRPFVIDGRDVVMTASIGISLYPDDGLDAETLVKHADSAMYHAKSKGRDNCQFYSASLTQQAMQRLDRASDLRRALERNELSLVYQPQFELASGQVRSVEALIRWNHPTQGSVAPLDFIPLAEEIGLIVPIGEWVLRKACADAAAWQRAGHGLQVAVNLSPIQFKDAQLVERVRAALAETGLTPSLLELEITEGTVMEDSAATLVTLNALRDSGVKIALDDFGTGYSSMSYLKRMPIDNLKVDRSFVSGLPDDRESHAIVRAILSLAKSLGFAVTAEGVETLDQAQILNELACDKLQGFYFSRPVRVEQISDLLKELPRIFGAQNNMSATESVLEQIPPGSSEIIPA
jgi:diguanylate cyclase (GGDEF)-like protein/PAS domain S-box-containing protein